MLRLNPIL